MTTATSGVKEPAPEHAERPIGLVPGTRDWLSPDCARLAALETLLLDAFRRAGYERIRTPILEYTELHQRKSGAGIVSKLFEVDDAGPAATCLRPELTASVVRAYAEAAACPPFPGGCAWRGRSSAARLTRAPTGSGCASSPRSASRCSAPAGPRPTPRSSAWRIGRWPRPGAPTRRSGSGTSG